MGRDHHHHFREHPRSSSEAKGEHCELKMLLPHCEQQLATVALQDGDVEISVLQADATIQSPGLRADKNWVRVGILNVSFRRKALRG